MTTFIERPYLTDLALARRLERAEATSNAAFAEARARVDPDSGAAWIDIGGTFAMFDGPESPVTQTFGLGLFSPPSHEDLVSIERFFLERGSPVFHEVSPIADEALLPMLVERQYHPLELTSVMHRPITSDDALGSSSSTIHARLIEPGEENVWADTAARGWSASPDLTDFMH